MTKPDTAMPDADRPWERPGAVRREVEPHRGRWFRLLAWTNLFAVVLAVAAVTLLYRPLSMWVEVSPGVSISPGDGLLLLPVAPCFPLGLITFALAGRHLAQMRAGLVDPAGTRVTTAAQQVAILAMVAWGTAAVFAIPFLCRCL
jgi:hypothetical protein